MTIKKIFMVKNLHSLFCNNKLMRKNTSLRVALLCVLFAFVLSASFASPISLSYDEKTFPGDPIHITLNLNDANATLINASASLSRSGSGKQIISAKFFAVKISEQKQSHVALLCTDSSIKQGNFIISVKGTFATQNQTEGFEVDLPLVINEKEFVKETLYLNETNTAIKTNTSKKRTDQIDRLNAILFSTEGALYEKGRFVYPVASKRRTSFFGDRRIYEYSTGKSSTSYHYGIDYGVPTGTAVMACGKGKVVLVEDRISTGWSIVVQHAPSLYSLYYHLSKPLVKEGDIVNKADVIAESGATGLATGPHLHWELRLHGTAVNPDFFITHPVGIKD